MSDANDKWVPGETADIRMSVCGTFTKAETVLYMFGHLLQGMCEKKVVGFATDGI